MLSEVIGGEDGAIVGISATQTARHYCQINVTVPVLKRFFYGEDTRPDFRLGREAIQVLLGALQTERQHGWGPTLETLVFLFWIATGSAYRVVARVFGMPITSIHRMVHRIAEEVVAVREKFIRLPQTEEELLAMGEGFARLAGHPAFIKAAGAMAVCDHQGRFIDTYMGFPGSVHDSRILRNSLIYLSGNYPPPGYFILGDGGYPCLSEPMALITPYKRPLTSMAEQRFNTHHSRGRSIVERAFGMMKTRFRCIFLEALEVHSEFVPKVVTACAVLHNICIGVGDEVIVEDVAMGDDPPPERECGAESRKDILPHQKEEGILPLSSPLSYSHSCSCHCSSACPCSSHLLLFLHPHPNLAWAGGERAHDHWR
ncbi:putative nuclease HARBI1 [Merluccius polli]|uniref:Nuclease HARBI1 n=1 Tax=Merluccius polli TaxID=89951 RepID=A0AA47N2Y6_MERPO|nr:putative nuclease HARBI1 [Merluccius polli]